MAIFIEPQVHSNINARMQGTCRGMFYNKFTKDDQSATNQIEGLGKKKTMLHILDWVISKCNTQFTFVLTNQTSHKYY